MRTLFWLSFVLSASISVVSARAQSTGIDCVPDPMKAGKAVHKPIASTRSLPSIKDNDRELFAGVPDDQRSATVFLTVHIFPDGSAGEVTVKQSTGSNQLDELARGHVNRVWRWEPPVSLETCKLSDAYTDVRIEFFRYYNRDDARTLSNGVRPAGATRLK